MKNLKFVFAAMFAFAFIAVLFAFVPVQKQATFNEQWFEYDGQGPIDDPSSYGNPSAEPVGCNGSEAVCSIKAMEGEPNQPELTQALIDEINAALANPSTPQPNVELRN